VSSVIALPRTAVPIIKLQTASVPTSFGAMSVISMDISFIFDTTTNDYQNNVSNILPTLSQQHQHHQQQQHFQQIQQAPQPIQLNPFATSSGGGGGGNNDLLKLSQTLQQQHSGVENTRFVSRLCTLHPPLAALVLVLKQLLHEKGLNDPFKGGLGAYGLTVMAAAVCQVNHPFFTSMLISTHTHTSLSYPQ
jgi:hypothetical protein